MVAGVGPGMGRSIALLFAREGARLALGVRNEGRLRAMETNFSGAASGAGGSAIDDATRRGRSGCGVDEASAGSPAADREWGWQWVFPASQICTDPRFGAPKRYHQHESVPQRAIHAAARQAAIAKPVSPHSAPQLCDASAG